MTTFVTRAANGRLGVSETVQTITAAGAIRTAPTPTSIQITGPASSTYAITLAQPAATDLGAVVTLEMLATTGSNAVTLSLANCVGQSSGTTCSFNSAGDMLVLLATSAKWLVLKESGVALS